MQVTATVPASPAAPLVKRFTSAVGEHLLVVPHSRIFDIAPEPGTPTVGEQTITGRLAAYLAETATAEVDLSAVVIPPPQSLSLNVSSSCNLGCSYCYADRGGFQGAQSEAMTAATARAAADALLTGADQTRPITIGFLGGEPLRNRELIRDVVEYASSQARRRGLDVRFAITTNGTLLTASDIALFRDHAFAVTVSIDGDAFHHDAQRPMPGGRGSFRLVTSRLAPLLARPGGARIAGRMTVQSGAFDLQRRLDAIWALGFAEAGVSPLRMTANGGALHAQDWSGYLAQLTAVARGELTRAKAGCPIRLSNFAIALKQIDAGACSPYPCGAGGGYFSLAANGDWYTCHRAIGNAGFRVGTSRGLDEGARRAFVVERHVHAVADCRSCWARYLCSGGCHQEADARSPQGCDFIRSWLEFCLASYCELTTANPTYFSPPAQMASAPCLPQRPS